MATTKAQQKAVNKYRKNNYDLVQLTMPKGRKAEIKAHAETHGESAHRRHSTAPNSYNHPITP